MLLCVQFEGTIGAEGLTFKLLERRLNNNFEPYKGEDCQIFRGLVHDVHVPLCQADICTHSQAQGKEETLSASKFLLRSKLLKVLASLQVNLGQFLHEEA